MNVRGGLVLVVLLGGCGNTLAGRTTDIPAGAGGTITVSETAIGSFEAELTRCESMAMREFFAGVDLRSQEGTTFVRVAMEPLDGPGLLIESASHPEERVRLSREQCSTLDVRLAMDRAGSANIVQSYGSARFECTPESGGSVRGELTFNCM